MIWREGQITDLAAHAFEAGALIDTRLGARRVDVGGAAAWGQFIDDDHHSPHQWGLFGTTAAVRTLSLRASPVEANRHIREALPLIPRSRDEYDPRLQPKVDKGDFQNIIRLVFIAEALEPGRTQIPAADRPPIVEDILACTRGEPHWNPTSAVEGAPQADGDVFTTAYVLLALRRYEEPVGELRPHRTWLAQQLLAHSAVRARPDLTALVGLALQPRDPDPAVPEPVRFALKQCQDVLLRWCRAEPVVLHRPLFQGFNFGRWTDYVFLHPELVAALFFVSIDNPRPARRFVATVVGELVANIRQHGYFEGRPAMGATVDQMWASRLLDAFHRTHADPVRRRVLMPALIATSRTRWVVVAAAVVGFAVIAAVTSNPAAGAVGAAVAVLIGAALNFLVAWGFGRD